MNGIAGLKCERLGSTELYVSAAHRFGTDAFLLADFAAPRHKDAVCDLCSGCGIVALIMRERFSPKYIEAVEIDKEAHELLVGTVQKNGLENFRPVCADLRGYKSEGLFDVITCNPPYKRDGAGIKSARTADVNARHEVLCTLADVCKTAAACLNYGGRLCICNRPERLADMMTDMRSAGIEPKRLRLVSKDQGSPPWLALVEGRKGGKPFLTAERGFFMYDADGSPSEELRSVYISELD